jgi:hypothetical protein
LFRSGFDRRYSLNTWHAYSINRASNIHSFFLSALLEEDGRICCTRMATLRLHAKSPYGRPRKTAPYAPLSISLLTGLQPLPDRFPLDFVWFITVLTVTHATGIAFEGNDANDLFSVFVTS